MLEQAGVVLTFRHPLLRSAAWHRAGQAERRKAHAALAAALPAGSARTWHRAEAASGYDRELALELAATAQSEGARRGYAAASVAYERAARLMREPADAMPLLAAAAESAHLAGDGVRARRLAREVLDGGAGDAERASALFVLGQLEEYTGTFVRARELFAAAAEAAEARRWPAVAPGAGRARRDLLPPRRPGGELAGGGSGGRAGRRGPTRSRRCWPPTSPGRRTSSPGGRRRARPGWSGRWSCWSPSRRCGTIRATCRWPCSARVGCSTPAMWSAACPSSTSAGGGSGQRAARAPWGRSPSACRWPPADWSGWATTFRRTRWPARPSSCWTYWASRPSPAWPTRRWPWSPPPGGSTPTRRPCSLGPRT